MEKYTKQYIDIFLYIYIPTTLLIILLTFDKYKIISFFHIIMLVLVTTVVTYQKNKISEKTSDFIKQTVAKVETVAKSSYKTFPVAILIVNKTDYNIKWFNEEFKRYFQTDEQTLETSLFELFPNILPEKFKNYLSEFPKEMTINDKIYKVYSSVDVDNRQNLCFYFNEVTADVKLRESSYKTRPVVAIISIDNYDELLRNATDTENSIIVAAINTRINAWTKEANGIFKKYDRDRYLFILSNDQIDKYTAEKFPILDLIREIQTTEGIKATLSIGVGRDAANFADTYNYALNALEMALSRGGDQVVIKNKYSFEFYGGLSKEVEKRTKVKSRVVAGAINQIIKDSQEVYIMGHIGSDFDSLGAGVGICAAIRNNNIPHKIIIDIEKSTAKPLIDKLLRNDYYKDIFITPEDALIKIKPETLLIVVDTNRPSYVESKQVLDAAQKVVVIDHHRRAADYIENATVNMHEPYASSTCEIVAELLQYMLNTSKITKTEAEALLAGIMLDTKHFSSKTGSRTFEAAAYLKRVGAEVDQVKSLFQNDFTTFSLKNNIANDAKVYDDKFIISTYKNEVNRAIASQCADELLNISNISASFVIFKCEGKIHITARSNKINVQLIMESLGGGGSINAAAATFESDTTENVERLLKEAIDNIQDDNKTN